MIWFKVMCLGKKITEENKNNSSMVDKKIINYILKHFDQILLLIFILCCILYVTNTLSITNIKIDTILAIVAIVITAIIFRIQDEQLSKLENIGSETKEITVTLQTDSVTQENIKNFFPEKIKPRLKIINFFSL